MKVLKSQEDHFLPYKDDIIFSNSWEEYLVHIKDVLVALRDYGLTVRKSKCLCGMKELDYL